MGYHQSIVLEAFLLYICPFTGAYLVNLRSVMLHGGQGSLIDPLY